MTNPFMVNPGGVIQTPGIGDAVVSGIANVLAAQQQQAEQQYRLQQLALQQQQQQALAQYYQGQLSLGSREQGRLEAKDRGEVEGKRQAGLAMQGALGVGTPQPPLKQVVEDGAAAIGGPAGLASIFSGVSPENMGAAVQGVQEAQELQPKEPELPTSGQEFEYLRRLASRDPAAAQVYWQLIGPKGPSTVINNVPAAGETEFSKELAKAQVEQLQAGEKEARQATTSYDQLNQAYGLVDKSFTGFGANQLLGLARVAGAAGFKPGKDRAADTQTLMKLTRDQVISYLQTRALGSGTAVSDQDRIFMERQAGADIALEPTTIKRIIRINVGTGIMRTQDAINDLRDQAISYPQNARQLNTKADALQRKLDLMWKRYSEMLQDEGAATANVSTRAAKVPGVVLPRAPR